MTESETAKLVASAMVAYQRTLSRDDLRALIAVWYAALGEFAYGAVNAALGEHIRTSEYFPKPAELRRGVTAALPAPRDEWGDAAARRVGMPHCCLPGCGRVAEMAQGARGWCGEHADEALERLLCEWQRLALPTAHETGPTAARGPHDGPIAPETVALGPSAENGSLQAPGSIVGQMGVA